VSAGSIVGTISATNIGSVYCGTLVNNGTITGCPISIGSGVNAFSLTTGGITLGNISIYGSGNQNYVSISGSYNVSLQGGNAAGSLVVNVTSTLWAAISAGTNSFFLAPIQFGTSASGQSAPSSTSYSYYAIAYCYGTSTSTIMGTPTGWLSILDSGGNTRKVPYY
jgi:hypothetical protein